MTRLKAPRYKVLPWLERLRADGLALLALPIRNQLEALDGHARAQAWYKVVFDSLARAFDDDELTRRLNARPDRYFELALLPECREEWFRVQVSHWLAVVEDAIALARGRA